MGKTNSQLIIWVDEEWENHPKIQELKEKGHTIIPIREPFPGVCPDTKPHLIISHVGWRWNDKMWDYSEDALKEARKVKKGNKNA